MKGIWSGKYWFKEKLLVEIKPNHTNFEMVIEHFEMNKFLGTVKDDLATGGTKGIGKITGNISDNKIQFVKNMPIRSMLLKDGIRIEEDKPHRPIYYKGTIDKAMNKAYGTWRFKRGFGLVNGKLAYFPGTKGEWSMHKKS